MTTYRPMRAVPEGKESLHGGNGPSRRLEGGVAPPKIGSAFQRCGNQQRKAKPNRKETKQKKEKSERKDEMQKRREVKGKRSCFESFCGGGKERKKERWWKEVGLDWRKNSSHSILGRRNPRAEQNLRSQSPLLSKEASFGEDLAIERGKRERKRRSSEKRKLLSFIILILVVLLLVH